MNAFVARIWNGIKYECGLRIEYKDLAIRCSNFNKFYKKVNPAVEHLYGNGILF